MRTTDTSDLWWKTSVIYCLDVETFCDGDGDGRGDFGGLAERLEHLVDLGITCLWLMPFYPTPDRDDGYDITDFYGVDGRLGTLGDLVEVVRTANDRGMRVIADVVVNHTSSEHPWFQAARSSRDSPYRDFYIWRDEPPQDEQRKPVFPDQEKSVWTYDEEAGQYYLHVFYRHQPDLNVTNPAVRDELAKVLGTWLQLGLAGFRVDAVPFFLEGLGGGTDGSSGPSPSADSPEPHEVLRDLARFVRRRRGDAVLLGEVNLPYEEQLPYFGGEGGLELTMQFDFTLMQRTYLAMARADATPIREALQSRPPIPVEAQWANFLRNHDELTLDKLSESERQEVFAAFGPDEDMQLYGRGLRRRLPPMLGDPRRVRMAYSLMFSLPGTPVLFYGEEIGMGENLDVPGRAAVRTPMQWAPGSGGGFSTAEETQLVAPFPEGAYAPQHVNVQDQRRDPESLLAFLRLLVERYRDCPELGWGAFDLLEQPHACVLAHRCSWDGRELIALHNLSPDPVVVPLSDDAWDPSVRLVDLLVDGTSTPAEDGSVEVRLEGYGYRWLRVLRPGDRSLL